MRLKIRGKNRRIRKNHIQRAHKGNKKNKRNRSLRTKRKKATQETDLIPHLIPVHPEATPKDLWNLVRKNEDKRAIKIIIKRHYNISIIDNPDKKNVILYLSVRKITIINSHIQHNQWRQAHGH